MATFNTNIPVSAPSWPHGLHTAAGLNRRTSQVSYNGCAELSTTSQSDVWNVGGLRTLLTTAQNLEIVSTSALDTESGTGAQEVILRGLDGDYLPVTERVTLDGTTTVTSENKYLRLLTAQVGLVGSTGYNQGVINITSDITADTVARIDASEGANETVATTISATEYGFIVGYYLNNSDTRNVRFELYVKQYGEAWKKKRCMTVSECCVYIPEPYSIVLGPKSEATLRATKSSGRSVDISATMVMINLAASLVNTDRVILD